MRTGFEVEHSQMQLLKIRGARLYGPSPVRVGLPTLLRFDPDVLHRQLRSDAHVLQRVGDVPLALLLAKFFTRRTMSLINEIGSYRK